MSSPQRDVICKVKDADKNNTVLLLYMKQSNKNRLEAKHPEDTVAYNRVIFDIAGYFTRQIDAQNVADCLNRLIPLEQINGKYRRLSDYYVQLQSRTLYNVSASYEAVGNFAPHEYVDESIISIAKTKAQLNYKQVNSFFKNANPEMLVEGPFIKRYVVNDIMPTMHLDDYDLINHKERFNEVVEHLSILPGSQQTRKMGRMLNRTTQKPHIAYSDSSDSEDESKWRGITDRSLMKHIGLKPIPKQPQSKKRVQKARKNSKTIKTTKTQK